ncbi:MAG: hypothetical protein O7D29_08440 [Gemmatimonadetes bacterium]|nr:hypothetical protein [Gemmatimonadota bacterium]
MTSTHLKQHARLTMEQRVELAGDLRRLADGHKVAPEKCEEARRIARDLETEQARKNEIRPRRAAEGRESPPSKAQDEGVGSR